MGPGGTWHLAGDPGAPAEAGLSAAERLERMADADEQEGGGAAPGAGGGEGGEGGEGGAA
jgi:hypothetical protein